MMGQFKMAHYQAARCTLVRNMTHPLCAITADG
jgi:hypothetical protein